MKNKTKNTRIALPTRTGQDTDDWSFNMSLTNFITECKESKDYFRRLVVRAIEDAILIMGICIGIAGVCAICSLALRWMGVA